ncbi:MAG: alpha/beta fold hydrolase, partial [Alphaproteobacteria bacterium]|nr:alpha/beta fold hydrolase [Alphaproteobacteria bacterium]
FDMSEALGNITAPALILVGEDDLITTPNQARKLADLLPNAQLHVFPNTGHNPFVEETADFNRIVAAFLAETR